MARKSFSSHGLAAISIVAVTVLSLGYAASTHDVLASLLAQEDAAKTQDDVKNQQQNLKDQNNYLKNLQREVQDAKREVKTLDTSSIDSMLANFQSCLNARTPEIGTSDFWTNIQECQSFSNDVEDKMRDTIRPQRNCGQVKKNIDNRRREKKDNLDRQTKDILRNDKNADLSAVNAILAQINASFQTADQLMTGGCTQDISDSMNDVNRDLDGLFQDAYSTFNELNQKSNDTRQVKEQANEYKNYERQCKDIMREFKNFGRDVTRLQKNAPNPELQAAYEQVKGMHDTMCDAATGAVVKLKAATTAGDVDAFEEARNEFNTYQQDFWNVMNEVRQGANEQERKVQDTENVGRDLKQRQKDLKRMQREVKKLQKGYTRTAKKYLNAAERKQVVSDFAALVEQITALVANYEQGLKTAAEESQGDPEAYWFDRADELNDLQQQFQEAENQVRMTGEVIQNLTQGERELKMVEKQFNQMKGDRKATTIIPELQELVKQAREGFENAWTMVIRDPESAMMTLEDIFELRKDWEDTVNSLYDNM